MEEDDYKIGYLHDIKNIMPNPDSLRIFTTAWSAPPWMKITNSITWGEKEIFGEAGFPIYPALLKICTENGLYFTTKILNFKNSL